MKNLFKLCTGALLLGSFASKAQMSLAIYNASNSYSITCSTPTITLVGSSNYTAGPVTYGWMGPSGPIGLGATANVSSPGVYTLGAVAGSVSASKTVAIGINTTAPSSSLGFTNTTISCSTGLVTNTLISLSPTVGVQHTIYSPHGAEFVANSYTSTYSSSGPGTYTYELLNQANGCKTTKTFTITGSGFPTFSLTNTPLGYTVGCNSKSVTSVFIINASTSPTPGGPLSYTFLSPGSSSIVPAVTLSPISGNSITLPGTWWVIVRDNSTTCDVRVPFSIISNTMGPVLDTVQFSTNVLTCDYPNVLLKGMSPTPNITYNWSWPAGNMPSDTVRAYANFTSPTSTLVGNYTLTITDNNSTCKTTTVVPIYQNIFKPNAAIATGGNYTLTCATPSIVLTNVSSTGIPSGSPFPSSMPVIGALWTGPSPQAPATNTTTYLAYTGGTYTMNAKDLNNGCTSTTAVTISDTRVLPAVSPNGPFLLPCSGGTVDISPTFTGSTSDLTYNWQLPVGATAANITSSVLIANAQGNYTITVTNTLTGCATSLQVSVWACVGLNAYNNILKAVKIFPNPGNGRYTLEYSGAEEGLVLEAYNNAGILVARQKLAQGNNTVNLEHVAPGIYMVQLKKDNRALGHTKVIKQ